MFKFRQPFEESGPVTDRTIGKARTDLRIASPSVWLGQTSRPGDLVLTGSRDIASRLIQFGTKSQVSHAAVVASSETVIEAYDYGLTPNDEDEGVFETTFEEFVARSPRLDRIVIRRPDRLGPESAARIRELLDEAVNNSPPFPTTGTTLTCTLLLLARPGVQRLLDLGGPRLDARVDRLIDWLVRVIADGPERVHCSEIATRVYSGADVELRFMDPVLEPYLARVRAAKETQDGTFKVERTQRRRLSALPRHLKRRARRSKRPSVEKGGGSKVKTRTSWEASGGVVRSSVAAARRRIDEAPSHEPDLADLILPADLERAEPFTTVSRLVHRRGAWHEVPALEEER